MWVHRHLPRAGRTTVAGGLVCASWAVFGGLTVAVGLGRLAGITPSVWLQSALYLALMVGISLPHGGFEHVENLRGRGDAFQVRYLLAYLLLVCGSVAVFLLAPLAGLGVALAVTALKGGHGGLHVLDTVAGTDHLSTRLQRALAVFVRGGAVVLVPLVFHPGIYYMVASYMVGIVDPGAIQGAGWLFTPGARTATAGVYGAAVLAHLLMGLAGTGDTRAWRVDATETGLLVLFFAVVPPILAIGVYFPCWYATRQVARLSGAGGGRPLAAVSVPDAVVRFVRGAALPWLGSVALLFALAAVVPRPPASVPDWMAFYSVFVAVIAVPHVVVGAWLDRRQGIWAVGGRDAVPSQQ